MHVASRSGRQPAATASTAAERDEGVAALGVALGLRADECVEVCASRAAGHRWEGVAPSADYVEKVRGINWLSTLLVARWLVSRVAVSEDEMRYISRRGDMAAAEQQSSVNITRAYMIWRDTVLEILRDEARRLGSPREALSEAQHIVRVSSDASMIQVARAFDVRMAHLAAEVVGERETLRHLALHDTLTGLPNRVLFYDRLNQAILAARRHSTTFAVLLLDLDGFKDVNDALGHQCGDGVLQEISARLVRAVRESDTVARWGGDEFAVLLAGATARSARAVVCKLDGVVRGPIQLQGSELTVGAAIGTALYPAAGADVQALLVAADVAMYRAKRERAE